MTYYNVLRQKVVVKHERFMTKRSDLKKDKNSETKLFQIKHAVF